MQTNKNKDFNNRNSGHDQKRNAAPATPDRHDEHHSDSKGKAANDKPAHDVTTQVTVK